MTVQLPTTQSLRLSRLTFPDFETDRRSRPLSIPPALVKTSIPFANVGPLKIESDLPDEKVLFLSDIFPTGYMAAENAQIQSGDTVAVWGCGPVGQFAIASAFMLGAARVIAIDRLPERLELARSLGAIVVDYSEEDVSVLTAIKDLTGGVGPDACIDAVGLEAHSSELQGFYDKVKTALMLETDRPSVLRQAIQAVRKGGTLSISILEPETQGRALKSQNTATEPGI
jgi:threonine dehydrogenase-like Zn-dependent dehydrogenase